jgi:membrane protein
VGLEKVATPAISLGLALAPYVLIWLLFTLIYLIMPNTRVPLGEAALAAVLAGSAYQLLQIGYVRFQLFVTGYNAIYGSFAALPLFLIWLQLSWVIVLFGAEIAHAFPDSDVFEPEGSPSPVSAAQARLLALAICHAIVRRFHRDEPALREADLAREFDISRRQARTMTDLLVRARLVCRVHSDGPSLVLQPSRDSANVTVRDVIAALDNLDASDVFPRRHPKLAALTLCLRRLHIEMGASPSNALLRDIDPAHCDTDDPFPATSGNNQFCTKISEAPPE